MSLEHVCSSWSGNSEQWLGVHLEDKRSTVQDGSASDFVSPLDRAQGIEKLVKGTGIQLSGSIACITTHSSSMSLADKAAKALGFNSGGCGGLETRLDVLCISILCIKYLHRQSISPATLLTVGGDNLAGY